VVALPRENYVDPKLSTASMSKFVENAIHWLAKKAKVKIASDQKRPLSKYTQTVQVVAPKELSKKTEINVYFVDAFTKFDGESVTAIQGFVEKGGGLLIGGHCQMCDTKKPSELPGNKYGPVFIQLTKINFFPYF
jgi:type 1 glutamine amidotransferase